MAKKYTSEEVLKIIEDYGYEILDFKYKNTKTKYLLCVANIEKRKGKRTCVSTSKCRNFR